MQQSFYQRTQLPRRATKHLRNTTMQPPSNKAPSRSRSRNSSEQNHSQSRNSMHFLAEKSKALIMSVDKVQEGQIRIAAFAKSEQLTHQNDSNQRKGPVVKLQRYGKSRSKLDNPSIPTEEQQNFKGTGQIGLLRRIMDQYRMKPDLLGYYNNLANSMGIKVHGSLEAKKNSNSVRTEMMRTKMKKGSMKIKHELSLKMRQSIDSRTIQQEFFNNRLRINAQGFLQSNPQEQGKPSSQDKMRISRTKLRSYVSNSKNSKKNHPANYLTLSQSQTKFNGDSNQNTILQKVNKYRDFTFMINLAHGIYRHLDIEKYSTSLKVYVGSGNNGNLIKAIMKKRFWFEFTKNKSQAQFVWTQLKQQAIFGKQKELAVKNSVDLSSLCVTSLGTSVPCKHKKIELDHSQQDLEAIATCRTDRDEPPASARDQVEKDDKKKDLRVTKINMRTMEMFTPQLRVLTKTQLSLYNDISSKVFYKRRSTWWDRARHMKDCRFVKEELISKQLIHNHLPLNGLLGNKKALFYMLQEYCRLTNRPLDSIVPCTYHVKTGLADPQYKLFLQHFNDKKKCKVHNYWIVKPGEFSNRGQGITCTDNTDHVRRRVNQARKSNKTKTIIVQEYISNPMLYNGRKFDIRAFMLISTNNGKLRAYWYQQGYVRTSSYLWKLEEITDPEVHLTNDAIQQNSPDYGRFQPANKLNYAQLQRYFDTLPRGREIQYNFHAQIYPKMKEIASSAVRATYPFIRQKQAGNNFEIFGFDFMIDQHFKPWLIEINTNPCLEVNCPVLERVIPGVLEHAFRIAVDPIFPPPSQYSATHKYHIPENATHYNKFELIFDEDRDGEELERLYQGSKVVEEMEQYQEEKELYEDDGEEMDLRDQ